MKKTTLFRAALVCLAAVLCLALFAGCSGSDDDKLIRVGGTVTPHCEILEQVRPILEEQGYTVEIVQFDDYVLPNNSTEDGELLANFFQHQLYLDDFNEANGTHLVSVADIHYEPFGIYPGKTASLEDKAYIAVICLDPSKVARLDREAHKEAAAAETVDRDVGHAGAGYLAA